ncbi:MAG: competence protein CoiA [Enterococcus sp.]
MLFAQNENSRLIDARDLETNDLVRNTYYCPACASEVILKNGLKRVTHFAHKRMNTCSAFSEGETEEHLELKRLFSRWFVLELEKYIPTLKQRPDGLIENQLALEIQCSPLSAKRFIERTKGYQTVGLPVWWIVGSRFFRKNTYSQLTYLASGFDRCRGIYFWQVDWERRILTLVYQVRENFTKPKSFMKKNWKFNQNTWQEIFYYQPLQLKESSTEDKNEKYLEIKSGKLYLQKKLFYRKKQLLIVQEKCYLNKMNLNDLPRWMYLESAFYYFFKENIWWYRILYSKNKHYPLGKRYVVWLNMIGKVIWDFPLVSKKEIFYLFYQECMELEKRCT